MFRFLHSALPAVRGAAVEEKYLVKYRAPVLLAVGMEGFWGLALCALALPALEHIRGADGQPLDSFTAAVAVRGAAPADISDCWMTGGLGTAGFDCCLAWRASTPTPYVVVLRVAGGQGRCGAAVDDCAHSRHHCILQLLRRQVGGMLQLPSRTAGSTLA